MQPVSPSHSQVAEHSFVIKYVIYYSVNHLTIFIACSTYFFMSISMMRGNFYPAVYY